MTEWLDAEVGKETVAFRTSEDERNRLEELRAAFGLKSKSQVLRAALDALELMMTVTDFSPAGQEDTKEMVSVYRVLMDVATPDEQARVKAFIERFPASRGARWVAASARRKAAGEVVQTEMFSEQLPVGVENAL